MCLRLEIDGVEIQRLEAAIEAILFTMGESVELKRIAAALNHDEETTKKIIHNLMDKYDEECRGIKIIQVEGAYQMCTKPEYFEFLIKITSQPKNYTLTDVQLETLSIIAYKQPITRIELEKIRGVKCDHAVNKLIEYNLVNEVGRLDAPGRPLLFGTTEEFLRQFGLKSIDDLPSVNIEKIEDFKSEAKEEIQLKLNL